MSNSSTITAPNNEILSADSRKSSSTTGLSSLSLNLLIRYIDNVLSAIHNQGLDCKIIHSGKELRDLVQPVASDFSKIFEGISEGAKMFSDQKFLKSRLSTEAQSMAVDVLKGLGNAHWVAVGLLAIANVLERFDNISANDRECIDLLKAMLKLGKYLKQMKDLNVKLDKEILEDMFEAVQLIVSGVILCRFFITSNKLSKFLLTKKIRDELVYVRGKVNAMKADLMGHMQLLIMKTLTLIHGQYITGRNEENNWLGITEQYESKDTQCESEMEQSCKTELDGAESDTVSSSQGQDNCNEINERKLEMSLRSSLALGKFLRERISTIFRRQPKVSPYLELQMLVKDMQPSQIEFKRNELKKATKGFSQIIGNGGFGSVYSGILSDGRRVAVKVLAKGRQSMQEWTNELTVTKLQHPNIVELVGYCFDNMILVYECMQRNLSSAIFEVAGEDEMIIDWPTRHNIILDIIRGLVYLHEGADVRIVHRDIKPNNILLDEKLNAKICDFGIARIMQLGNAQYTNKEISTHGGVFLKDINNFSSLETDIAGTRGYLDPEYIDTFCVTLKSDIYSFGMLLLNVVSGKQVVVITEEETYYLAEQAWRLHEEDRLTELIDPRLNTDALIDLSSIVRTIKIALWCIQRNSESRPSASRALMMLSSEEEIPIPSSPFQSSYNHSSKDAISICNSSSGKSSVADDHSSEQEIPIPTSPVESYIVDDHFLEEKILSPTLPLESSSADDNFSQEKIHIPTPPIKSSVAEDHSSEEEIPIASPRGKSIVAIDNSIDKKIEESDRKWSGASLKTLRILCVFSLVSFICLFRMFTNVSPL